jgi:hypothetical protein
MHESELKITFSSWSGLIIQGIPGISEILFKKLFWQSRNGKHQCRDIELLVEGFILAT